ncbi:MAG: SCP2 sterol-binding domain-containing protein [Actinobacteria bacterium]|nr:SCP2 sterol-binding domain-containing protein [Actinomycetota bacterium]
MAKHAFLSDEWFAIVEKLVEEHSPEAPPGVDMVTNIVVTDSPFGAERHLHMSSRGGRGHVGIGHASDADATVTTDYETAKEMFTSGDPNAAMQAFLAGKLRIQGDLAKMMAAQAAANPATANEALLEAIQGVTE